MLDPASQAGVDAKRAAETIVQAATLPQDHLLGGAALLCGNLAMLISFVRFHAAIYCVFEPQARSEEFTVIYTLSFLSALEESLANLKYGLYPHFPRQVEELQLLLARINEGLVQKEGNISQTTTNPLPGQSQQQRNTIMLFPQ
jgi:hypothetical protein